MFEYGVAAIVATAVVAVLSHVATRKYYALKAKASLVADLFQVTATALEDNILTEEELEKIAILAKRLVE